MSNETTLGRRLAYVLRHGLTLSRVDGWLTIEEVSRRCNLSPERVAEIVAVDNKGRFRIEGDRVRALHGHSVSDGADHLPSAPPATLFHGTTDDAARSILREGLRPMQRTHVHLSDDTETALVVAARRQGAVVLVVDIGVALAGGTAFSVADNGIWLSGPISPEAISVQD